MSFGMNNPNTCDMTDMDYSHPDTSFLCSIDIHTLLPQQDPFVMVGSLVAFDMQTTVTETIIGADNLFVDGSLLSEAGLIENVAQTCAVRLGYVNKYILKEQIQIGYIGAVRNMDILSLPSVGDTITTTVTVREEVFGVILADASVRCGDSLLVSTEMKIAVK